MQRLQKKKTYGVIGAGGVFKIPKELFVEKKSFKIHATTPLSRGVGVCYFFLQTSKTNQRQ
jgi:hypothetical protein